MNLQGAKTSSMGQTTEHDRTVVTNKGEVGGSECFSRSSTEESKQYQESKYKSKV